MYVGFLTCFSDFCYTDVMEGTIIRERMGNPRYVPKRYTDEPKEFGRAKVVTWKPDQPGSEDQRRAAQIQHDWAVQIRWTAVARYGSLTKYAEATGLNYDRLIKVLSGREIMRLEDIAQAERLLGVKVPVAQENAG
jgi:hypothetical protein